MTVLPDAPPRALVQLAHGMAEHKERYLAVMQFLADKGFACIINDHRGHGASVLSPDDLGYFYKDGGRGLVKDMHQLTMYFKKQYPGVPIILFGHSMGSLAGRAYAAQFGRDIDGLILSGSPGFNPAAKFALTLTEVLSFFGGGRHARSKLMANLLNGAFSKAFKEQSPFAWLSANPENVVQYEADPLCGFVFTLNGYRALLNLMLAAYDKKTGIRRGLPVHFMAGEDDPCAPNAEGFHGAIQNMKDRGCLRATGKMYPGLRHEILNEGVQEVWDDLARAIEEMLP
jgi:alpha-beta hydrolase superfamily lysophospholipase